MENEIQQAADIVLKGGVIAYPTDTVYGLGTDPFNEEAVERIYQIKQRPINQPLSLLIGHMSDAIELTSHFSKLAGLLADRFWPGGVTLVIAKSDSVPEWITCGGDTVAVRVPEHPLTLKLIRFIGKPLIGTSANISGRSSAISAEDVKAQLGCKIDFVLDGGICPGGLESTVVDVTGSMPIILRQGAISSDEILKSVSAQT